MIITRLTSPVRNSGFSLLRRRVAPWSLNKGSLTLTNRLRSQPLYPIVGISRSACDEAPGTKTIIRPAETGDCKAIYNLLIEYETEEDDEEGYTNTCEDLLTDGFGKHPWYHSFVAETLERKDSGDQKKEVIGFVIYSFLYDSWRGRAVNICGRYLRKDQRSNTLGTALAHAVILHAADEGCKQIQYTASHSDARLRKMYDKMGAVDHSTGVPDFKRLNYYTITGDNLRANIKLAEQNLSRSEFIVKLK